MGDVTELIEVVSGATLPAFLTALLVFGFAPGFVLRLIVKLYPKDDPRRRELVAELYALPRLMRPIWVAEQIETAMFEGASARTSRRRVKPKYSIGQSSGFERFLRKRSKWYRRRYERLEIQQFMRAVGGIEGLQRLRYATAMSIIRNIR